MNAKYKQTVICAAAVAVLFLSSVVYAQPFGDAPEGAMRHKEGKMEKLSQELQLTPEQQEQITEQRTAQNKQTRQLRNKLQAKRRALRGELEKQEIDRSKIYALVAEIKTLLGNQVEQRVEGVLSMKQILTPEQVEKLQQKRREGKGNKKSQRNTPRGGSHDKRGGGFHGF